MGIGQHLLGTLNERAVDEFIGAAVSQVFKGFPGGFQMELKTQDPVAVGEGLVLAGLAPSQVEGPAGQVKGLAVPVKDLGLWRKQLPQVVTGSLRGALNGKPADLGLAVLVYLGAENIGDELAPQADAQNGFISLEGLTDEVLFGLEPRRAWTRR